MALRIKSNVDLKGLEKFGYRYNYGCYHKDEFSKDIDAGIPLDVQIDEKSRYIGASWGWYWISGDEVKKFIQDLIKADLVEKVGE